MAWSLLFLAGIFEIAWVYCMKMSHGFSVLPWTLAMVVTATISFALLGIAMRDLPVGTSYAVWTGIGAAGTALIGIVWLDEPRDLARVASLLLIVAGVVGLKLSTATGGDVAP